MRARRLFISRGEQEGVGNFGNSYTINYDVTVTLYIIRLLDRAPRIVFLPGRTHHTRQGVNEFIS